MSNDIVKEQYQKWVYPEPLQDLSNGYIREQMDPSWQRNHVSFWPDRADWEGARILVAGCGTNQAASIAYHNRGSDVIGIDVSSSSLAHEMVLKEKHCLDNLQLLEMPLEGVRKLDMQFDLIICSGVLHHLRSPEAGLQALHECLKSDGSLSIMLYGKYPRAGVYMLQNLFRLMNLGQSEEDVKIVRDTLATLHPDHVLQPFIKTSLDAGTDSGLVDLFLHGRDVAYSVDDCLDLLDRCGLNFQSWLPSYIHLYYPNYCVARTHPIFEWGNGARERDLWSAMELFASQMPMHCFVACRKDRAESSYEIDIVPRNFDRLIPVWRQQVLEEVDGKGVLRRSGFPDVVLNDWQLSLVSHFSQDTTIADCLRAARITEIEWVVEFFESMRRLGYCLYALKRQ